MKRMDWRSPEFKGDAYIIQVAPEDCTGCTLCVEVCPIRDKSNVSRKALNMAEQPALRAAPMGSAVGRWLQARRCYLTGNAVQALSLRGQPHAAAVLAAAVGAKDGFGAAANPLVLAARHQASGS